MAIGMYFSIKFFTPNRGRLKNLCLLYYNPEDKGW